MLGFIGDFGPNGSIVLKVRAFGRVLSINHTLSHFDEGRLLGWSEQAMPGIVDNHQFLVAPLTATTSRFVQTDELKGWGVPLHGRITLRQIKTMYPAFNTELKAEAERRAHNPIDR